MNKPVAWISRLPEGDVYNCAWAEKQNDDDIPLYTHPVKDREADRLRFSDEAFNRWLDENISDSGHTVYDLIENVKNAWDGWNTSQYYTYPVKEESEQQSCQEADGCPTEIAVLQRFWRKHHLVKEPVWKQEDEDRLDDALEKAYGFRPLKAHPVKELTDEEIDEIERQYLTFDDSLGCGTIMGTYEFARAILRKAQEK